jgi:hypothetical protein
MKNNNVDSFAYVIILDRYISEKFYEMMIDSNASTKSIVEYDQYLAFKNHKIDSFIDLNHTRTETVNVQFDIELASSIKSLTIDILFEIIEFHVIKTDISFLLSLADMNRLKVYFNNVINSLIQMIKISSETFAQKEKLFSHSTFRSRLLIMKKFHANLHSSIL